MCIVKVILLYAWATLMNMVVGILMDLMGFTDSMQ